MLLLRRSIAFTVVVVVAFWRAARRPAGSTTGRLAYVGRERRAVGARSSCSAAGRASALVALVCGRAHRATPAPGRSCRS